MRIRFGCAMGVAVWGMRRGGRVGVAKVRRVMPIGRGGAGGPGAVGPCTVGCVPLTGGISAGGVAAWGIGEAGREVTGDGGRGAGRFPVPGLYGWAGGCAGERSAEEVHQRETSESEDSEDESSSRFGRGKTRLPVVGFREGVGLGLNGGDGAR